VTIEISPQVIAAVSVAAFLIGLTKAGLGGGLGPVITAVMILTMPVEVALGILLPMLIVGDIFSIGAHWKKWDRRHVVILGAGAVVGVALGTLILTSVEPTTIQRIVGVVSLSFVAYRLIQPRLESMAAVRATIPLGVIAGAAGGAASTVAHAGAPPVAIYLLIAKVSPVVYAATHVLLFAGINLLKVPAYLAAGLFDLELQLALAPTLIFLPLGVVAGRWLVHHVTPLVFDRIILGVLTATGIYLLFV
jgi:uncharacterized protein